MEENIIEIQNLSFGYDEKTTTINNISFAIQKGSYVTILGHNGSGKSTIAKLLIGLLPKKTGDIIVAGKTLNIENLYAIRRHIGIVFQNPDNQFIGSTVRDDIAFGLENIGIPSEDMESIINTYAGYVDMKDFLDHEPLKLSGGQKQRVAIAGILAMHPDIIILDEATSMLDPKGRREINALVRRLNRERNMTIISISHDIEEATESDSIILLKQGRIETIGTPEEVLTNKKQLQQLELDIPFALKISQGLREEGISVKEDIHLHRVVEELCQLHSKK